MAHLKPEPAEPSTSAEKYDLLRQALTFACNTAPYALTDDQYEELLEFIEPLDPTP